MLSECKNVILVLSGKGGVGKTTTAVHLAQELAKNYAVGILDLDLCGPNVQKAMKVSEQDIIQTSEGWEPVMVNKNLCIMSISFLLKKETDPIIWRGPKKNSMISQFVQEVNWPKLDFLIVDTPPGTSDEHISAVQVFKPLSNLHALLISTPQNASLLDVQKEVEFCLASNLHILGLIENMSGYTCECGQVCNIFSSGGSKELCKQMNIEFLGDIPIEFDSGKFKEICLRILEVAAKC